MCGRFSLTPGNISRLGERFALTQESIFKEYKAGYNIAPGQKALVIVELEKEKRLQFFRWGLVPFWAKDQTVGSRLINTRAETAAQKPAFRCALARRRCLVPADGFYEWKREGRKKIPYRFCLKDDYLFAFAGIWEEWKDAEGRLLHTFAILTMEANEAVQPIHNRMPVILKRDREEAWLDEKQNASSAVRLLEHIDSRKLKSYEVSTAVNSPQNNGPEVIRSVK